LKNEVQYKIEMPGERATLFCNSCIRRTVREENLSGSTCYARVSKGMDDNSMDGYLGWDFFAIRE
jgi:hypothetical protein